VDRRATESRSTGGSDLDRSVCEGRRAFRWRAQYHRGGFGLGQHPAWFLGRRRPRSRKMPGGTGPWLASLRACWEYRAPPWTRGWMNVAPGPRPPFVDRPPTSTAVCPRCGVGGCPEPGSVRRFVFRIDGSWNRAAGGQCAQAVGGVSDGEHRLERKSVGVHRAESRKRAHGVCRCASHRSSSTSPAAPPGAS